MGLFYQDCHEDRLNNKVNRFNFSKIFCVREAAGAGLKIFTLSFFYIGYTLFSSSVCFAIETTPESAAQAVSQRPPAIAPEASPSNDSTPRSQDQTPAATTVNGIPIKGHSHVFTKAQRKMLLRAQRQEMRAEIEVLPVLKEVLALRWDLTPQEAAQNTSRKITLEKCFQEVLEHNLEIRQAAVQLQDTEGQAKESHDANFLSLLNPLLNATEMPSVKKAEEAEVETAKAHFAFTQQKVLLNTAQQYRDLSQRILDKALAYSIIQQEKNHLKVAQEQFVNGDTERSHLTQAQISLMGHYQDFLAADHAYHLASMTLASQIGASPNVNLIPERFELEQIQHAGLPTGDRTLIPETWSLEKIQAFALVHRADRRETLAHQEALHQWLKVSPNNERAKRRMELHQTDIMLDKITQQIHVDCEKAYTDFQLAEQHLKLSQERYVLANQVVEQLRLSQAAGFTSSQEMLEWQIQEAQLKIQVVQAQLADQLSQLHLLFQMGLLSQENLSQPLTKVLL